MVKILVVSDNHGDFESVTKAAQSQKFDRMFHCGDFCGNLQKLPPDMLLVAGNCDDASAALPEERLDVIDDTPILAVHGHHYNVYRSLLELNYKAAEAGAKVVFFGHTHFPTAVAEGGRIFVNPGSLSEPRGYSRPTFAVVEWEEPKKTGTSPSMNINVRFYNLDLKEEVTLSNSFRLTSPPDVRYT